MGQKNIAAEDFLSTVPARDYRMARLRFTGHLAVLALPFLITLIFTNESLR
jgi:hypothetical protein